MKGQKQREEARRRKMVEKDIHLTKLDLVPLEVTPDSFFRYLVDSRWVQALCAMRHNPYYEVDELYHEVLLVLWDRMRRICEVYESVGLMAALGYVRIVAQVQCGYGGGACRRLRGSIDTVPMGDILSDIDETYDPDTDPIYHLSNPKNDFDTI